MYICICMDYRYPTLPFELDFSSAGGGGGLQRQRGDVFPGACHAQEPGAQPGPRGPQGPPVFPGAPGVPRGPPKIHK